MVSIIKRVVIKRQERFELWLITLTRRCWKKSHFLANLHLFRANPQKLPLSDAKALKIDANCIHILPKTEEVGLSIGENIPKKADRNLKAKTRGVAGDITLRVAFHARPRPLWGGPRP